MKIERQLQGILSTILSKRIEARGLQDKILLPVQEEGRADVMLVAAKNNKNIFFIELKDPTTVEGKTIYNFQLIYREAKRAEKLEVIYFGICNFTTAALLHRDKILENSDFQGNLFSATEILNLQRDFSAFINQKYYLQKIEQIADFYLDKALEILQNKKIVGKPLDATFIFVIQELINAYTADIALKAFGKYQKDREFRYKIQLYAQKQQWNTPTTYEEIENITTISLLVLVSKLIFYKTCYDNKVWTGLSPLQISENVQEAADLKIKIWSFFEEFKEATGDFELLIGEKEDIIFDLPFVSDSVIEVVKKIIESGKIYDFSKIEYDIIGRIFEGLIRPDERHQLGQYFTPSDVIDLMLALVMKNGKEKVFDPSCGSGTFLVRAYQRKRQLSNQSHRYLLEDIYGNDLANYPAYLAMLNLAIRNVSSPSYPKIINQDFFSITDKTKVEIHDFEGKKQKKILPKFDIIIGNPPYTRQEDIGIMQGTVKKETIQQLVKDYWNMTPSARTSIYAYFFYHAAIFLKENGYLAFIVSNSWLDTDFGADLQRFMLKNFQIVAIMDSALERFFPDASVNTTMVVLKKESKEEQRNNHLVQFVYFKNSLANLLKKYQTADKLVSHLTQNEGNNSDFSCRKVPQSQLDQDMKWGKYLKAPQIYFDILEKGKNKFVPLNKLAEVRFGIKTGCNEFFILEDFATQLTDKDLGFAVNNTGRKYIHSIAEATQEGLAIVKNGFNELWLIEKECVAAFLTSPKDVKTYHVQQKDLTYMVLRISEAPEVVKDLFPYTWKYILYGEKMQIHERPTCKSRKYWYSIGNRAIPPMSFNYMLNDAGRTFLGNFYSSDNLHNIFAKENTKSIWLYLNSTISWFLQQNFIRTNFGDGVAKIQANELANFPVIQVDLENADIDLGQTKSYKEELGTLKSLKTVNPQRLKLDSAILTAIGFVDKAEREKTLLELYRVTAEMIEARFQKAQSMDIVKKEREKVEIEAYVAEFRQILDLEPTKPQNNLSFAKKLQKLAPSITSNLKLQKKIISTYWQEEFQEPFDEKKMIKKEQGSIF